MSNTPPIPRQPLSFPVGKDTCFYDGQCGLCRKTVRRIRRLDWLRRLEFKDMLQVEPEDLPFPLEEALKGMPMRTRDGRALIGFPAVRRALLQTPLGFLPALLLYIPGISHAAHRTYVHIATHRKRDGVCMVRPEPESA